MSSRIKAVIYKRILICLAIVLIVLAMLQVVFTARVNRSVNTLQGDTDTKDISVFLGTREGNNSTWTKKDCVIGDIKKDLYAQTFDGRIKNNSSFEINDWSYKIKIKDECYLNNAWCGTVEVHQHVGTKDEKVQIIDFRNYDINNILLDYYDETGDLLVPLANGDYVVYRPSLKEKEAPLKGKHDITIGIIFYYPESIDLSEYQFDYFYHKNFTQGICFDCIIALFLVWMILLIIYCISKRVYITAQKEMEIKKSGFSCMSDIYSLIYIVDLEKDELIPVSEDDEFAKMRSENLGAKEQFEILFSGDCTDSYRGLLLDFIDISTLGSRMKDKDNLVCEYYSKRNGWSRLRFFAMEKADKSPGTNDENENISILKKVVFTIQDINEEKKEMDLIELRVEKAEYDSEAKSRFMANTSTEILTPINFILDADSKIIEENNLENIKKYANDIRNSASKLLFLINGILDFTRLDAGLMKLDNNVYSPKAVFDELIIVFEAVANSKQLEFEHDISKDLPEKLLGDSDRIKQIIANLMMNSLKTTKQGKIKMSVFGKINQDKVHMLFSIKDTGIGLKLEEKNKLIESLSHKDDSKKSTYDSEISILLVARLLEMMNSKLEIISTYEEGTEYYFEIEQNIS